MSGKFRRFLVGWVIGAALFHVYHYHGDEMLDSIDGWLNGTSGSYRSDRTAGQAGEL